MKLFIAALFWLSSTQLWAKSAPILTVADTINPGTGEYLIHGIESAKNSQAPYVVIQLDTPGGLLQTTREIVQAILNTEIPVVVFVGPKGAHAGSAGALITFAADVAAMAPGTNIGAAHPVGPQGESPDKVMDEKIANDVAAFAESLAKAKGRNTEWAAKAVRKSASISAEEALKLGVVDLIAEDLSDLRAKLSARALRAPKGALRALPGGVETFEAIGMGIRHKVVSFFANPSLAYILLSAGGIALWIELSSPGFGLPGILGIVSVLISLVSFQLLPISLGALGLMVTGIALLIAEAFLPTFGLVGLGGLALFILGSLFVMDSPTPEFQIPLRLILPTAAVLGMSGLVFGWWVLKAQRRKPLSGPDALIGQEAEVKEAISKHTGKVLIVGELWNAFSLGDAPIAEGARVRIVEVRGMRLGVTPI